MQAFAVWKAVWEGEFILSDHFTLQAQETHGPYRCQQGGRRDHRVDKPHDQTEKGGQEEQRHQYGGYQQEGGAVQRVSRGAGWRPYPAPAR